MKATVDVSHGERAAVGAGVELAVLVKVSTSDGRLTTREGADSVHPQAITPNSSSTMPTQNFILSILLHPVTASSTFRNVVSNPSLYGYLWRFQVRSSACSMICSSSFRKRLKFRP
jgi:hypothetical protein